MKKLFVIVALMGLTLSANAQSFNVTGNTYTTTASASVQRDVRYNAKETQFTWEDGKGEKHAIWVHVKTGSCFVIMWSEAKQKEYRKWLGREVSADICKRLGREYKPTERKEATK